jgi:hypothetical protein
VFESSSCIFIYSSNKAKQCGSRDLSFESHDHYKHVILTAESDTN